LDSPEDFIRLEVETALSVCKRVVPALVDKASMPSAEQLPEILAPLARRNAIELDEQHWKEDVKRLGDAIGGGNGVPWRRVARAAAGLVVLAALGWGIYWGWPWINRPRVPLLVGQPQKVAIGLLAGARLKGSFQWESSGEPAGTVIRQDPPQ